ncbi:glomulin-like isoform X1 [Cydia fagiglandana]|uniref:glomulin-like isoform X1 n=1 Tax=Cydia fagiglandana TaxID=1458189 RepID=UPI002FEE5878
MSDTVDVVDLVSKLLDSGKYKEVLSVHNEEKYARSFKDNCWDMISVAVSKIQDETIVIKPSLYSTCEELLAIIVQKATPEEALLEFIEQVEVAKNDAQFGIVLTPLQQLLKKLSAKRGRSLEWSLNSISTYMENIPTPEFPLEGRARLLAECDPNIRRIIRVYSLIPPFYQPFIEELKALESNVRTKQIIAAFLISLLGKPLIYLDLDIENNEQSEARLCCTTIVKDICSLEKNILKFLEYVEICNKTNSKLNSSEKDVEKPPYDHTEKLNMLTLSGLYYVVLSSQFDLPDNAIPQVYATEYIVHTGMLCAIYLLNCPEYGPQSKGLTLCDALVKRLSTNASYTLLSAAVHFNLCKALINIAIFSSYDSLRKTAVNTIRNHINCFEYGGRCMLIKYIISTSNHSGMIGYAITLLKNAIDDAFKDTKMPVCFTYPQMMDLIKKVCHMPHGAQSDLMELSDQIISVLNFLRYLVLRDKANVTGIKECYTYIESDYLSTLRNALNLSKAHYEVKLKDVKEGTDLVETKISINVGGNPLDSIPDAQKIEIINSALNCFHLMDGLVARLSECITVNI